MYLRARQYRPRPGGFRFGNAGPEYQLDGLGKLKLKKVFKKVGKVLKKVAPIAATFIPGVGPMVGPAVAAFTARKKQAAQAAEAAAMPGATYEHQVAAAMAANQAAMAQQGLVSQAVQQYQPPYIPPTAAAMIEPTQEAPRGALSNLPQWAIPAAIGGAALLFILSRKR